MVRSGRIAVLGMGGICAAYFLILLDAGVLNLALPAIQAQWGSALSDAQWVLDGYVLPLASLLMISGRAGDRWGHRRMLLIGIVVLLVSSAVAAAAPSLGWLILARVGQGIGGAVLLPATLALIPHLFDQPRAQERAVVAWVGVGAVAMAIAPLVGGALIAVAGWRSIFVINLPVGLIALVAVSAFVTEAPRARARFDVPGQILLIVALGGFSGAAIFAGRDGWGSASTIGCLSVGAVALLAFVAVERRVLAPLVPGHYLLDRVRLAAILAAGAVGFSFYGAMLLLSLTLQTTFGQSPLIAGVGLLPLTVATLAGPFIVYPRLTKRFRPQQILTSGLAVIALGCIALAAVPIGYPILVPAMLLIGAASTTSFSALTTLLLHRTVPSEIGLGSALQNTTRQTGSLMAYAVIGALFATGWHIPAAVALALIAATASVVVARARSAPALPPEQSPTTMGSIT